MPKICFLLTMLLNAVSGWSGKAAAINRYAIYYGCDAPASAFRGFDLVVLDSSYTGIIHELKKEHKVVLAYLSIGEINRSREYFDYIKGKGILLEENPNWADAYLVDIRKPLWKDYLVETLIPAILDAGFDGIFVDTLDSPIEKERETPKRFKGMKVAAVEIIAAIRKNYPEMKIMINRGFEVASELAPMIDYLLAESICNSYDFGKKKYFTVSPEAYAFEVKRLHGLKKINPRMLVMTLDYCDENDQARKREIMKIQKKNGFIPYIATLALDKVYKIDDN